MDFIVRWLHVASASFLFGGAFLVFAVARLSRKRRYEDRGILFGLMSLYEWGFWGALGFIVMTGVGNLGHFGEALPSRSSHWGNTLTIKLLLAGGLLLVSLVRTLSLALLLADPLRAASPRSLPALEVLYGVTVVLVAGILALAVTLAHF